MSEDVKIHCKQCKYPSCLLKIFSLGVFDENFQLYRDFLETQYQRINLFQYGILQKIYTTFDENHQDDVFHILTLLLGKERFQLDQPYYDYCSFAVDRYDRTLMQTILWEDFYQQNMFVIRGRLNLLLKYGGNPNLGGKYLIKHNAPNAICVPLFNQGCNNIMAIKLLLFYGADINLPHCQGFSENVYRKYKFYMEREPVNTRYKTITWSLKGVQRARNVFSRNLYRIRYKSLKRELLKSSPLETQHLNDIICYYTLPKFKWIYL